MKRDGMKLSNAAIKKMLKEQSDIGISDSAAEAIARILEKKAKTIAKYAVKRAKQKGRRAVMQDDVDSYRLRYGG